MHSLVIKCPMFFWLHFKGIVNAYLNVQRWHGLLRFSWGLLAPVFHKLRQLKVGTWLTWHVTALNNRVPPFPSYLTKFDLLCKGIQHFAHFTWPPTSTLLIKCHFALCFISVHLARKCAELCVTLTLSDLVTSSVQSIVAVCSVLCCSAWGYANVMQQ